MWKFLIQQEGSQDWQLLEDEVSPLPEGRYRMVANSHINNAKVEIFILHVDRNQKLQPMPKYHRKSNEQGLLMVFSHKRLSAGFWQIICSTQEGEGKIDLEITSKVPQENQSSIAKLLENWQTTPQAELERILKTEIESYLDEHSVAPTVAAENLNLKISLNQNSFFCLQGEVVPIFAKLESTSSQIIAKDFTLVYNLRSLFESNVLYSQKQSITVDKLPFEFQYFLEIPQNIPYTTFKGEIILLDENEPIASEEFNLFTEKAAPKTTSEPEVNQIDDISVDTNSALPPKLNGKVKPIKEIILPSFLN